MSRVLLELSKAQVFENSVTTRSVGLAGFTILIWDHIISFNDEVELVWKGARKGPIIWLFFLNRYFIPLSFIINIFAYFSYVWNYDTCNHFVVYEGCMTMIGIAISGLMMFFRIKALYNTQPVVYGFVLLIWVTFVCVNGWLLAHAEPVFIVSPNVISCTMIFNPSLGSVASASAWLPLVYDTFIVGLTLLRALDRPRGVQGLARELAREGLMYYAVIFAVTLTLAVMIAAADPSVKNITAQLELCLTATMMSRVTLALKRFARISTSRNAPISLAHYSSSSRWQRPSFVRPPGAAYIQSPTHITRDVESAAANTSFFALMSGDGYECVAGPMDPEERERWDDEQGKERERAEPEKGCGVKG